MRRLWALLGIIMIGLTGCSPKKAAPPQTTNFSCAIRATYNDMTLAGTLTRYTAGTLQLTFTEPETLDGMTVSWDGELIMLEMMGLTFNVDPADVPESALGNEVIAILDAAMRSELQGVVQDGKQIFDSTGENGNYQLVCDAETGYPLSLSVPRLGLYAEFSDFA